MAVYKKRLLTAKPDQAEEEPSLKKTLRSKTEGRTYGPKQWIHPFKETLF